MFASADEPTLHQSASSTRSGMRCVYSCATPESAARSSCWTKSRRYRDWSEAVKRLWDADTRARRPLKVVLLGSAPLLVQRRLTESLAGRFEVVHLPHWTWAEMEEAFDWNVERGPCS